jgi:hypothetical protein
MLKEKTTFTVFVVLGVGVDAVRREQQSHHRLVPVPRRQRQRRSSVVVLRVCLDAEGF